jgi:hypothetical protein
MYRRLENKSNQINKHPTHFFSATTTFLPTLRASAYSWRSLP